MQTVVEKILASPSAPHILEHLQRAMQDEQVRRQDFREWITPNMKAEFINGEVILHSPVKRRHWKVTDLLSSILSIFSRTRKLGVVGTEKVMVTLTRNDYEPDVVFFSQEKAETFVEDQLLFPAPDFVVEILSKKTASKDRGIKKQDYAAHGIQEYWIVDPEKQVIEQYLLLSLKDTEYAPAKIHRIYDDIESKAIKGFVIPVQAIFDEAVNLETLQDLMK